MEQISQRRRYNIALEMGILYAIILLYTIIKRIPDLLPVLHQPGFQALRDYGFLFSVAETLFISSGLVAFYGLISIWLAEVRMVLRAGLAMLVVAGLVYLLAGFSYFQAHGFGAAIPQAGSMFMLCLLIPLLAGKLFMRNRRA